MTARRAAGGTARGAGGQGRAAAPVVLPAATHHALSRSAESIREALATTDVPTRYACAHVAALRATAALLSARARPTAASRRRQKNAWVLLAEVAPELEEWATFFAAGASTYAAAQAGSRRATTAREADDLVRDADRFLAVVETSLGLVPHAWADDEIALRAGVA